MNMNPEFDPYIELASEIVLHGFRDYISTAKRYKKFQSKNDLIILQNYERWFYSERFSLYCKIHPDAIMRSIRRQLNEDTQKKDI